MDFRFSLPAGLGRLPATAPNLRGPGLQLQNTSGVAATNLQDTP